MADRETLTLLVQHGRDALGAAHVALWEAAGRPRCAVSLPTEALAALPVGDAVELAAVADADMIARWWPADRRVRVRTALAQNVQLPEQLRVDAAGHLAARGVTLGVHLAAADPVELAAALVAVSPRRQVEIDRLSSTPDPWSDMFAEQFEVLAGAEHLADVVVADTRRVAAHATGVDASPGAARDARVEVFLERFERVPRGSRAAWLLTEATMAEYFGDLPPLGVLRRLAVDPVALSAATTVDSKVWSSPATGPVTADVADVLCAAADVTLAARMVVGAKRTAPMAERHAQLLWHRVAAGAAAAPSAPLAAVMGAAAPVSSQHDLATVAAAHPHRWADAAVSGFVERHGVALEAAVLAELALRCGTPEVVSAALIAADPAERVRLAVRLVDAGVSDAVAAAVCAADAPQWASVDVVDALRGVVARYAERYPSSSTERGAHPVFVAACAHAAVGATAPVSDDPYAAALAAAVPASTNPGVPRRLLGVALPPRVALDVARRADARCVTDLLSGVFDENPFCADMFDAADFVERGVAATSMISSGVLSAAEASSAALAAAARTPDRAVGALVALFERYRVSDDNVVALVVSNPTLRARWVTGRFELNLPSELLWGRVVDGLGLDDASAASALATALGQITDVADLSVWRRLAWSAPGLVDMWVTLAHPAFLVQRLAAEMAALAAPTCVADPARWELFAELAPGFSGSVAELCELVAASFADIAQPPV